MCNCGTLQRYMMLSSPALRLQMLLGARPCLSICCWAAQAHVAICCWAAISANPGGVKEPHLTSVHAVMRPDCISSSAVPNADEQPSPATLDAVGQPIAANSSDVSKPSSAVTDAVRQPSCATPDAVRQPNSAATRGEGGSRRHAVSVCASKTILMTLISYISACKESLIKS